MSISLLVPRIGPLEEARTAFVAAEYERCLERLHGNGACEAALLAARAFLRLRCPDEAERVLRTLARNEELVASIRLRAEHALLVALALSRRGALGADEAFASARALAMGSRDDALVGETEMLAGVDAFARGDLERAEMQAGRAFEETNDPVVLAWTRQTLGAIAALRGNLEQQLAYELENLTVVEGPALSDVWLESWVLYNLSVVARELDRHDVLERVAQRAANLAWTPATAMQQFQTFRHLAYAAALNGDNIATFRNLRVCAGAAPGPRWSILIALDAAFFFRELGETTAMLERIDAAREQAAAIDWRGSDGEERFGLLELVELVAPLDPVAARAYLATYRALPEVAPHYVFRRDPRPAVIESQQRGLVAAALGDVPAACGLLSAALSFWEARGIAWRAASAAVDLAILTRDALDVARAERYAARWPHAWFARRLVAAR